MATQQIIIPKWEKKYEIGIPEIDFQHKYFLELIKRFYDLAKSGISKVHIHNYLKELSLYTQFHFCSEENIMSLHAYPAAKAHKQLHIDLIEELTNKIGLCELGELSLNEVTYFLVEWFIDHTQKEDLKLAYFLNNN